MSQPVTFPATSLQLATTPGNVLYTCPDGVHARVDDCSDLNTSVTDRTVTYHIVLSGGSIADNNKVVGAAAAKKLADAPQGAIRYTMLGKVLHPGDFIQAFASAASAVTPKGAVTEFPI